MLTDKLVLNTIHTLEAVHHVYCVGYCFTSRSEKNSEGCLLKCNTVCVAGDQTVTFSQVVLEVMRHLEGAYALIFKSRHYPNELIACKRGSPLLLGVKVSYRENL